MIGIVDKKDKTYDEALFALAGLETDTKPTSIVGVDVVNGSSFAEIDTGKDYLFDEENQVWYEQPASGAGADYSTLSNKPQINSVTLSGNKTAADLALVNDCDVTVDSSNVLHLTLKSGSTIIATAEATIITVSIVETAYFDAATNELVIEFSNGQSLRFNLTSLLSGLLPMALGFTLEAANWTSDGAGGYMYDLTSTINAILANIPVYNAITPTFTAVTPAGSENPQSLHWCELLLGGGYVLSTDTTVQSGKTYYKSTQVPATLQWYEKSNNDTYTLSADTYVNPAKTYFEKTAKALNGTYQFNASADKAAQTVIDAGTATQIVLVTTKVSGVWKLYAMAKDGKPNAQLTLPIIMTVVTPSVNDMTLVGQAVYQSNGTYSTDTWVITYTDNTTENIKVVKKV